MHALIGKGLLRVVYDEEADMDPDLQHDLVSIIERELQSGPVAVFFNVKQARGVDPRVPAFWLSITSRLAPGLCAMAIASPSLAVRLAASAFMLSNKMRGVDTAIFVCRDSNLARDWASDQRTQAAARRHPVASQAAPPA